MNEGRKSDDCHKDGGFEALRRQKTTTVTRTATSRGPIPVTVSTFEAYLGGAGGIPLGGGGNSERMTIHTPVMVVLFTPPLQTLNPIFTPPLPL